jgi:glutathione S-transferase
MPYEERYERTKKTMLAPPELRAIHPVGKSTVITDDALTIAETGAIIDYLITTYGAGRLIPAAGTPERLRYDYWLHYAEGSVMPSLVMKLTFTAIPSNPALYLFLRPVARALMGWLTKSYLDPQIITRVAFWDAELAKSAISPAKS